MKRNGIGAMAILAAMCVSVTLSACDKAAEPISEVTTQQIPTSSDAVPDHSSFPADSDPVQSGVTDSDPVTEPNTSFEPDTGTVPVSTQTEPQETADPPQTADHDHRYWQWETVKSAACTDAGLQRRYCACGAYEEKDIPATGHVISVIAAVAPTQTRGGRTEGQVCTQCGAVLQEQTAVPATGRAESADYANDAGYRYLGYLENGAAMQRLYRQFDADCIAFHTTPIDVSGYPVTVSDSANGKQVFYAVSSADLTELGLSFDQAYATWKLYRDDHPLYYWIARTGCTAIGVSGGKVTRTFYLVTEPQYAASEAREAINASIYATVTELRDRWAFETDDYRLALAVHDEICRRMDYAYGPDGITPSEQSAAHGILGFFTGDGGVCEAYADTFALFMNYYGISNVTVSNRTHTWNVISLGNCWYWVDVTYDDAPGRSEGMCHDFFCVNDTQNVFSEYPDIPQSTFLAVGGHELPVFSVSAAISCGVPSRAKYPYCTNEVMCGDQFTCDGVQYRVTGFSDVRPVPTNRALSYPETVTYRGCTYRVHTT